MNEYKMRHKQKWIQMSNCKYNVTTPECPEYIIYYGQVHRTCM